jgi:hypothetical protein
MKTILQIFSVALFFAIMSMGNGVFAQNYSVLQTERTFLYEGSEGYIYGMRVDSVSQQGEDVVFHLLKNLQATDYYCFIPEGPSWMGNKILMRANGESIFYNINNEPVTIKTRANLNETWNCYTTASLSFRATVSSIEMGEILGLPDSLKTLSFQALNADGQNIAHPVNELQVVLSKNYGMQKTLNFYNFPQQDAGFFLGQLQQMTLVGFDQPETGIQDLNWKEVHDYAVGDILHTEEINNSISFNSITQILKRVLGKQILGDTIVYQIEQKIKYSRSSFESNTFTSSIDTIDFQVGSNPDFDVLPGIAYSVNYIQDGFDINHLRQGPHNINKLMGSAYCVVPFEDTCYTYLIADGCLYNQEFIKGLGGPYYHCTYFWDEMERKLVYYKKGDIEWGTPIDFNVGVETPSFTAHEINIYPNPTNGMTYFTVSGVSSPFEISIYNVIGQEVMHVAGVNQALDLGSLPKGMYLVKIFGKEFYGMKKLEKR